MIKDLDPDEVPEFWKELEAGGVQRKPKLTTKEILKKVSSFPQVYNVLPMIVGYRR
jgi:hypothetical protein